jgi:capsule polysaccharide export protein KpsE/RkpR
MDINKVFEELGRMHLEIMQLRENLAQAQAQLAKLQSKTEEAPKVGA